MKSEYAALGLVLLGLSGCATVDRFASKMDMQADRMVSKGDIEYEGRLKAMQAYGAMYALEFADGKMYDVEKADPALMPGDTVRIYKSFKGLEARLWKAREDESDTATAFR